MSEGEERSAVSEQDSTNQEPVVTAGTPGAASTSDAADAADAAGAAQSAADASADDGGVQASMFSGSPAKVMRIGAMVKQLLEEVRSAPLDTAARTRLVEMHERSLRELEDGLSADLVDELRRISLPFSEDAEPSDAELRIAQAQLVGWLEGLFHGLQTALVAQQVQTQAQLTQMRRGLPPGAGQAGIVRPGAGQERPPGQYL